MPETETIRIEINLGNDAMRTGADVCRALQQLAKKFRDRDERDWPERIMDVNGNSVGFIYYD